MTNYLKDVIQDSCLCATKPFNTFQHLCNKDIVVIYHGDCLDGFGAAYSAWKIFKDNASYIPLNHHAQPPNVKNKTVYILDFSFSNEVFDHIISQAKEVILLDHHKTAQERLKHYSQCHFDLTKSGAVLAWEHFHPNTPIPKFIQYIQDGDLLLFEHTETIYFYHASNSIEKDFKEWEKFENQEVLEDLLSKGKTIDTFFQSQVQDLIRFAKPVTLFGENGLMINAPFKFANAIGKYLCPVSQTYVLVWSEIENEVKCSLRAFENYDCSFIAKQLNGGGHANSAAFSMPTLSSFINLVETEKLK